jgi:hypothetical protein
MIQLHLHRAGSRAREPRHGLKSQTDDRVLVLSTKEVGYIEYGIAFYDLAHKYAEAEPIGGGIASAGFTLPHFSRPKPKGAQQHGRKTSHCL